MSLFRLIYVSVPIETGEDVYDSIFESSRRNNGQTSVTGSLVYHDAFNMQVLEGPRKHVSDCFIRIARDNRHGNILIVAAKDVPHRLFPDWAMHRLNAKDRHSDLFARYSVNGLFEPLLLSQTAVEELCRGISYRATADLDNA
ncbi:BLUF domain-containing protein [Roseisalinus antarcticus]|uniref:Sensors of blue-light using FAD n=1 Tax=Roseisalinus antarcticus TaxID=254357 RepID=A0A1Y5RWR7_9RHOB|nr:BLUF domain-containing protein [Roseisalinus antarcticus]SLN27233.1 Sensors of blue-light using FAD [Roseisalinus antarcticus]